MNAKSFSRLFNEMAAGFAVSAMIAISLAGCKSRDQGDGAPPPGRVIEVPDMNLITIDENDLAKFPIVKATRTEAPTELTATGSIAPDISREVPVISLANGRVVDVKARLDDNVKKGQLLFSVQSSDVTNAFNAYIKAVNGEQLANTAYQRAQDLYQHGAIAQGLLEQAEATEKNAKADLTAADEQLKLYGVNKDHPSPIVNVYAPTSGVIIAQNITNDAAAGVSLSGSATAFTIADMSRVWIVCDVYENDLGKVHVGQEAQIKVNAYPDKPLNGHVSDIGPVLDPNLRTAKLRIEAPNPGFLKLGMFVTATFTSREKQAFAVVPADAVLHLHDREWVYEPAGGNHFRRVAVRGGAMLDGNRQQILEGVTPGDRVVTNALMIDAAGNQ
jgi:membrane fusion protein, heavy metal efflux system